MIKSLKSLSITLWTALSLWAAPALAAGTIPLAMAQQIDVNGQPIAGCLLNFYVAGTVATQQNNFADFGLTTAQSNPLQCDQSGRIPMFWLADGLIHIRLTDSQGSPIIDTTMQVLGPSSGGGGGGGTVDPTAIIATGDIKVRYDNGPLSGFVRCNALTIGNGSSGASERANADTQALWIYLYGKDPNIAVSGGRTGNALNDYNAGKQLTMPDWRGRTITGLADMGNSASPVLTGTYFAGSGAPTVLGAAGGNQSPTLALGNLPASPAPVTATTSGYTPNVGSNVPIIAIGGGSSSIQVSSPGTANANVFSTSVYFGINGFSSLSVGSNTANLGSSQPFQSVSPAMVTTIYMKL